jgi:hypothetical protein
MDKNLVQYLHFRILEFPVADRLVQMGPMDPQFWGSHHFEPPGNIQLIGEIHDKVMLSPTLSNSTMKIMVYFMNRLNNIHIFSTF